MIYVLHVFLAITSFLVVLNGFLRGAKKVSIEAFLGAVLFGIVGVCFAIFGWKAGLAAIGMALVYGILLRPLAARVAARMLGSTGEPKGRYIGLPPGTLAHISRDLGSSDDVETATEELLSGSQRSENAEDALLRYCEANEQVKKVMLEFGATRGTLSALYRRLLLAGAGQWAGGHYVAASAIAYPQTLRYLLRAPLETRDQLSAAAFKMIMHFERGAPVE